MRKPLLILGTLIGLVALFVLYLTNQPKHTATDRNQGTISDEDMIPPSERQTVIGPVKEGLVRNFDRRTGQLIWQFQAEEYTPQPDGRVHVKKPEAVFFLKDEQMIRLRGANGLVTMPQQPQAGGVNGAFRPGNSPPSRGDLKQVQIDFFANQAAMDASAPELTINMENVAFDTETFRIFTEGSVIDGKQLTGEEIPVVVRGRNYDFDGRGLMIRWNERDRRLELLRIVHGDRLVVKDPQLVRGLSMQKAQADASSKVPSLDTAKNSGIEHPTQPRATIAGSVPSNQPLKDTDPSVDAAVLVNAAPGSVTAPVTDVALASESPATSPTTKPLPQVYRANFDKDVRVMQDGVSLVNADQLLVDFTFETALDSPDKKSKDTEATSSAAGSSPAPSGTGADAKPATGSKPDGQGPAGVAMVPLSDPDSNAPTTQQGPIEIFWSGELRVTPQPDDAPRPSPGGALVHLVGSPLKLDRDGRYMECGRFSFDTGSEEISMLAFGNKPLELTDPNGMILHTESLKWQTKQNIIQFPGGGQATLPLMALSKDQPSTGAGDDAQMINVLWTQNCRLEMTGDWRSGIVQLSKAQINGDVMIDSPEMHLQGQSLAMEFEPDPLAKAKAPDSAADARKDKEIVAVPVMLSKAIAQGNVLCEITTDNKKQKASGDYLEIVTARTSRQEFYPRQLLIKGRARLSGEGVEMSADKSLDVHFSPDESAVGSTVASTRPMDLMNSLVMESLSARENVNLRTADGAFAMGDQLDISGSGLQREISLLGDPEAKVSDGKTVFSGPSLVAWPNQQKVAIVGSGSLQARRPGSSSGDITIEWSKGASIDGKTNSGEVRGDVAVTTKEADGTVSGITADKALLELTNAPADPASDSDKADEAKFARLMGIQPMSAKAVSRVTFVDHTTVQSLLTDAQGNMLRRLTMLTQKVSYDVTNGKMISPMAGKLLYEDHRPADGQASDAIKGDKIDSSRLRGATAMEWAKQLAYDRATGEIALEKDVRIVHWPDEKRPDAKGTPDFNWELRAQRLTASLVAKTEDNTTRPGNAATSPAAGDAGMNDMARMTLQKITADGNIWFTTPDKQKGQTVEMVAGHLEFDPVTGLLEVTDNVEVRRGLSPGFFGKLIYNVREQTVVMKEARGTIRLPAH